VDWPGRGALRTADTSSPAGKSADLPSLAASDPSLPAVKPADQQSPGAVLPDPAAIFSGEPTDKRPESSPAPSGRFFWPKLATVETLPAATDVHNSISQPKENQPQQKDDESGGSVSTQDVRLRTTAEPTADFPHFPHAGGRASGLADGLSKDISRYSEILVSYFSKIVNKFC
jgi:hypothetical protein